ncbi:MAG: urea ABC transporter permease subunit UrtC, partial [Tardiphaga sp.]|nr:urea ABC transporter permease subunit UrtC [Tardiphaga sp.]
MKPLGSDKPFLCLLLIMLAVAVLLAGSSFSSAGLSPYLANAIGQLAAFAVLAISPDLIWGYLGILSLGHGLFFGVGGYVVAMYLL